MTAPSWCCWNRARPWHASELVSFLVGLRTYQHAGRNLVNEEGFAQWAAVEPKINKGYYHCDRLSSSRHNLLTHILLKWSIWWAPNNTSKWQIGFNSAFKGLNFPERRWTTQRWQGVGRNVGPAPVDRVGKKNCMYVFVVLLIWLILRNWLNWFHSLNSLIPP